MRRSAVPAILAAVTLSILGAPQALASHGGADHTLSATYETNAPFLIQFSDDGHNVPTGPDYPTGDGDLNLGGTNHRLPGHPDVPSFSSAWPDGENPEGTLAVQVTDDVFGANVGGFVCNDVNNNHACDPGVDGEVRDDFCDGSGQITATLDTGFDADDEPDFGAHVFTVVHGPLLQPLFCPGSATANPVGGTSGTVTYTYGFD